MSLRLDRLLSIVIKLLSYKRLTTKQLAQEFGVSSRTIYRDLQSISLAGVPVVPFQGIQGGWEILPDYLIDRRVLSVDDIANIVSSLQNVERGVSHPSIKKTVDKMTSMINPSKRQEITHKSNHILMDSNPWGLKNNQQLLNLIHGAIYDHNLLGFNYINLRNKNSKRCVEPMTLLLKGSSWYVFAYCLDRQDYRLFRLSRMSKVIGKEQTFIRRDMTIETYKKSVSRPEKMIKLDLQFHKSSLVTIGDFFGLDQVSLDGDYGTISVLMPENEWLYGFLLSFGDTLKVLSPKHIIKIIKTKANDIRKSYS